MFDAGPLQPQHDIKRITVLDSPSNVCIWSHHHYCGTYQSCPFSHQCWTLVCRKALSVSQNPALPPHLSMYVTNTWSTYNISLPIHLQRSQTAELIARHLACSHSSTQLDGGQVPLRLEERLCVAQELIDQAGVGRCCHSEVRYQSLQRWFVGTYSHSLQYQRQLPSVVATLYVSILPESNPLSSCSRMHCAISFEVCIM